jgi:hypothetical protein
MYVYNYENFEKQISQNTTIFIRQSSEVRLTAEKNRRTRASEMCSVMSVTCVRVLKSNKFVRMRFEINNVTFGIISKKGMKIT